MKNKKMFAYLMNKINGLDNNIRILSDKFQALKGQNPDAQGEQSLMSGGRWEVKDHHGTLKIYTQDDIISLADEMFMQKICDARNREINFTGKKL